MQSPAITTRRSPRIAATIAALVAAGAIGAGVAVITDDEPSVPVTPVPASVSSAVPLSSVDGALLHHHGLAVPKGAQISAADRFHHFR